MDKLQLALPVMLHANEEITQFRIAQKSLRELGDNYGVPIEVGVFSLFLPARSRSPESFKEQLKNQREHQLPIRLVETGVQRQNALSYGPLDPTFNLNIQSDLELVIDQAAQLRDLDPTAPEELVVAPHVGIIVLDSTPKGNFSKPGLYSLEDFVEKKGEIYSRARERFMELEKLASSKGLRLAIENAYSAVFENIGYWQGVSEEFGIGLQAFNDISSLRDISRGNLVFDLGHFAAMKEIPIRYEQNKDIIQPGSLFKTLSIGSWEEFEAKAGRVEDYLPMAHAFHVSAQDGLGIRVPQGLEIGRRWGDGTGPDLTPMETYHKVLDKAISNGLPVAVEEPFSFKPLTYIEADRFLEPILMSYVNRTK